MKALYRRIFVHTFQQIQREHLGYISGSPALAFDRKVLTIAVTVCISLACIEYIGKDNGYYILLQWMSGLGLKTLAGSIRGYIENEANHQLFALGYWVFIILLFYLAVPLMVVRFAFRQKAADYGLGFRGLLKGYKIYLLFLLIMVPIVVLFSTTPGFQSRYPFYRLSSGEPLWPAFWQWQLLYFFQFVGVEFFFRGFMVHGLKHRLGYYSVFVMTIPYCMIHFGKPFPETIAAIIAGIVLGTLSLKSRSIWLGVLIHYSVAVCMDISALWQRGYFG